MASRLTSFLSGRTVAVVWSLLALLFSSGRYWQWQSFEARQAEFLVFHARVAPNFPAGELDQLAPSSDFLVMFALLTGFWIAAAVLQWRRPAH
ncbi:MULTISPECIES: hypothetical protein [unclassified Brevundimonas]|uniref:hypothetical protein n=1 Tax=unclassified Brevundimonas TaxID=2622653 RepID=UPI0006F8F406|nr:MULTISPECIES: hypothetical protein [unclassified Brevundimonas]KQY93126.1 hypothetical protein ASD25_18130 [Brevundimonas sp. Root1423]KRA27104.1 hypothetical protein ASD59_07320 [Brevundimonas sp. Root608]